MLKEIAIVTITVANLAQTESAWQEEFAYETAEKGFVSKELSALWDAPDTEGSEFMIMAPANQAPVYLRFVEDKNTADYRPMTSHGWNATELLVRDTDEIAARLRDSAFTIVGEPKDLWSAPDAPRAMQALGPGNELLYLTTNQQAAGAFGLDDSAPLVERAFIMVVGGPSMEDFAKFYGETLGINVGDPNPFKITMISKANNLPIDTTYPLAIASTAPGYLIELDELPATVGPRATEPGHLPPGVAVVGFIGDGIESNVEWISQPRMMPEFPYNGRQAGLIQGPAGELIEVIID